ncbi:protein kinase domain-containing protein [Kitasatospora sp. NPDC004289]
MREGELVGSRYRLVLSVGHGAMARVWRAEDLVTGGFVAVKFLELSADQLSGMDEEEVRETYRVARLRFAQEGELLKEITHPRVPRCHETGSHAGVPYIVMDFIEGVPLNVFLRKRRPLLLEPAAAVAAQVADVLQSLHTARPGRPLLHRDVKPSNIMLVQGSGLAMLLDLGIAKPLTADAAKYTQQGQSLGTVGYQSPEQILGLAVTCASDVYGFGCVCYELLTGRPPFLEEEGNLAVQHLTQDPLPLEIFASGVPEELSDLVLRMLAKDPGLRPEMAEVLRAFDRFRPKPGDPAPQPRLDPDPTLPFRCPGQPEPPEQPAAVLGESGGQDDEPQWLSVRGVERDCDLARRELDSGAPGEAVLRLATITQTARGQWGPRRSLVREVWQLVAEGLRLRGSAVDAAQHYEQLAADWQGSEVPQDRAEVLVWRLRAAECRLPGAVASALREVGGAAVAAQDLPVDLVRRVRTVREAVEDALFDLGYAEEVRALLDGVDGDLDR